MYYKKVKQVENRLKQIKDLVHEKRLDARSLAKEIGVSVTTLHRLIGSLREEGYLINSVRYPEGWRYEIKTINVGLTKQFYAIAQPKNNDANPDNWDW